MTKAVDEWVQELLVCPRDHLPLSWAEQSVLCHAGHRYPVLQGVPVMLLEEEVGTQEEFYRKSLEVAKGVRQPPEVELPGPTEVDRFVQEAIGATNGAMYRDLIHRLTRYPIPGLPLGPADGAHFLEVGCNWGRWCVAAARKGYAVVGIDHNLEAIMAARRVSQQLGVSVSYVVADARRLPFRAGSMHIAFSYSVLQHFGEPDVRAAAAEVRRVLKQGGLSFLQMANAFGLRNVVIQARRRFRRVSGFEVRYWTPKALLGTFTELVGPSSLVGDGFFSLDAQESDLDLLPARYRAVIRLSGALRRASERLRWLVYLADSVYVRSMKNPSNRETQHSPNEVE